MFSKTTIYFFIKTLQVLLLITVTAASYYFLHYAYQYMTVDGQEIVLGFHQFCYTHGRFFGSFINNCCTEILPIITNIHQFDIRTNLVLGIQIFVIICVISLTSNGIFLFSKKKVNVLNPIFSLLYCVIFFQITKNLNFFIFSDLNDFFEYMMPNISYLLFLSLLFYYFVRGKNPRKSSYPWILAITFCAAYSVETVNMPLFGLLFAVILYQAVIYKLKPNRFRLYRLFSLLKLLGFYTLFLAIYELAPTDHTFNFDLSIFTNNFHSYFSDFFKFMIFENRFYFYSIAALFVLILLFKKHSPQKNSRIIFTSTSFILIALFYYSAGCYIVSCCIS